jgi:peptidoglycan/xylan/chitin deacetylase (PgdA/CDA1 family)
MGYFDFVDPVLFNYGRLFRDYHSGMAAILAFHRVYPLENNKLSHNEELKITPQELEKTITSILDIGGDIISIEELYQNLIQSKKPQKKSFIFTFDDGYKDNFTHAYPIFKKYNKPFTIYLATDFPDLKLILWWYMLEDILLANDRLVLPNNKILLCQSMEDKELAFVKLRNYFLSCPSNEQQLEFLHSLSGNIEIDISKYAQNYSLSWDEVKKLAQDPLITIGSHTVRHKAISSLSTEDAIREAILSKEKIQSYIQRPVEHFAYPFGTRKEANYREFRLLKHVGYHTCTTMRRGEIYPFHKFNLNMLPRIKSFKHYAKLMQKENTI